MIKFIHSRAASQGAVSRQQVVFLCTKANKTPRGIYHIQSSFTVQYISHAGSWKHFLGRLLPGESTNFLFYRCNSNFESCHCRYPRVLLRPISNCLKVPKWRNRCYKRWSLRNFNLLPPWDCERYSRKPILPEISGSLSPQAILFCFAQFFAFQLLASNKDCFILFLCCYL